MNLPPQCILHFLPTANASACFLSFCDLHNPNVPSSLRHWVPAVVNLSLPHTTSKFSHKDQCIRLQYNIQYITYIHITDCNNSKRQSQVPRGLRCRFVAARLLRLWVRITLWVWKSVCCECCVLLGRGLCDELISSPEESYRLWYVVVCDLETSCMRRS